MTWIINTQLKTQLVDWLGKQTPESLQAACNRFPEISGAVDELKSINPSLVPASHQQALVERARQAYKYDKKRGYS